MALILFLIPVKTEYKDRENELEETISNWSYSRRGEAFKSVKFTLKYDTTSYQADNPVLKKVNDYTYTLDNYVPTYEDTFHVFDPKIMVRNLPKISEF